MPQIKKWNLLIYALVFFGISTGGQLIRLATDFYWFQELGFSSYFEKSLWTQLGLGFAAAICFWAAVYANLTLARRFSKRPFVIIEPNATVTTPRPIPQLAEMRPYMHLVLMVLSVAVAFFVGNWAADQWETVLKFIHGVPFNLNDPLFNRDIGFYVFKVPLYNFVFKFFLLCVIFSFLTSVATYLIHSRVYVSERGIQIADNAKMHCAVLLGFFCLLLSMYFQLEMFDLLSSQRLLAPGAGFADVHAYLPGLQILRFISILSGIILCLSPWFPNNKIIVGALGAILLGVILSRVYTETVQKFEVAPNEIVKETPYLKQAILNTREAYGLSGVQELEFNPQEKLSTEILRQNDLTVKNIRLWEHRPLLTSYGQLQEIRTYYDFLDADNDRYKINGETRQVMLSVRELVADSLPSRIWINEHLTYTHGYGLCMGPVNRISPEGLPEFFIENIPPVSTIDLKVTRPEIYFGEARANYAIVKTKSKEFNYPAGEENVYTTYEGTGGVPVQGFWRRLLFALRFGELKILFSGDIEPESRFLYYRSVRERLDKAAPFIHFDSDIYAVVSEEGRIFWISDGYTVTDLYPYSREAAGVNYIRNSVKATVDAYNGTVHFYVSDPKDPIIQTYMKIFPGNFLPMDQMPKDLRSHIRYPMTLMNLQAKIYATYHMMDPQVFYNQEDLWKIPLRTLGGRSEQMEPYYTIMKLAGVQENEEFILMVPFTPAKKENMIAWMAARCDEPNYGKLMVYNFPKQKLVYGPQQIESRIDQDPEISKQLTLWDQGGSRVLRGSLLVIPVQQSLLYVQPLYLEASGGGLPELKRIIVAYGNQIAMEENLELSLMRIFGGRVGRTETGASKQELPASREAKVLIRQANERFTQAQQSLRQGDFANYGEEMRSLEKLLKNLMQLEK